MSEETFYAFRHKFCTCIAHFGYHAIATPDDIFPIYLPLLPTRSSGGLPRVLPAIPPEPVDNIVDDRGPTEAAVLSRIPEGVPAVACPAQGSEFSSHDSRSSFEVIGETQASADAPVHVTVPIVPPADLLPTGEVI